MKNYKEFESIFSFLKETSFHDKKGNYLLKKYSSEAFTHIFNVDDLENILNQENISASDVTLSRNSAILAPKDIQNSKSGYFNKGLVKRYIGEGFSVRINHIFRYSVKLRKLQRFLALLTNRKISINLYYTPGEVPCFVTHQDFYPLAILQIHGKKTWKIYPESAHSVLTAQDLKAIDLQSREEQIKEGHLLYLPELMAHDAFCENGSSIHLTIGFVGMTYKDLFDAILANPKTNFFLNRVLPYEGHKISSDVISENLNLLSRLLFSSEYITEVSKDLSFHDSLKMIDGTHVFTFATPDNFETFLKDDCYALNTHEVWDTEYDKGILKIFTSRGDFVLKVSQEFYDCLESANLPLKQFFYRKELSQNDSQLLLKMVKENLLISV